MTVPNPTPGMTLAEARATVGLAMKSDGISMTSMAARLRMSSTADLERFLHGSPTPAVLAKVGAWLDEPIMLTDYELVNPEPPTPRLVVVSDGRTPNDPPGFVPIRKVTTGPGRAITLRIDPEDERIMLSFPARNNIGRPKHVRVLISEANRQVLIVPSLRSDPNAYQMLKSGRVSSTGAVRTMRAWGWPLHTPILGQVDMGGIVFDGQVAE